MLDISTHLEEQLIENDFSTETVVSLFTMGMEPLNKPLENNFKELYYELKNHTNSTDLSIGVLMILVMNLARKTYEEEVRKTTHESIQSYKKGLNELTKLQNQIHNKIKKFEENYSFLDFKLNDSLKIHNLSKLSKADFESNLQSKKHFIKGLRDLLPSNRYKDDYYSNLTQIKIKNLISLYEDVYWPTFLEIINIIKKFYPNFLNNITSMLSMDDKDSVRMRLMQFESHHKDDKHLKVSRFFSKGGKAKV